MKIAIPDRLRNLRLLRLPEPDRSFRAILLPSKLTIAVIAFAVFTLHAIPVVQQAQAYQGNVQLLASALPKNVMHPMPQRKPPLPKHDRIANMIERSAK